MEKRGEIKMMVSNKKQIVATLLLALTIGQSVYADTISTSTADTSTVEVDRAQINKAELARREQLLQQGKTLKEQYDVQLDKISKLNEELEKAKTVCAQTCTPETLKALFSTIESTAGKTAGILLGFNQFRMSFASLSNGLSSKEIEAYLKAGKSVTFGAGTYYDAVKTNFKPFSTAYGRVMTGAAAVAVFYDVLSRYVEAKDRITLQNIEDLKNEIYQYEKQAKETNANLTLVTNALAQSIKITHRQIKNEEVQVGYDQ
ncbi:MAG: hypothetical protein ACXVCP_19110 [Bdellovibrio sp.]